VAKALVGHGKSCMRRPITNITRVFTEGRLTKKNCADDASCKARAI
jgi:hypothetical protein